MILLIPYAHDRFGAPTMEPVIDRDQTFVMACPSSGEEGADIVAGLFRATEDLDLEALGRTFLGLGADAIAAVGPLPGTHVQVVDFDTKFQSWLLREGLVERVPTLMLRISTDSAPYKSIGQRDLPSSMRIQLDTFEEDLPEATPSPARP